MDPDDKWFCLFVPVNRVKEMRLYEIRKSKRIKKRGPKTWPRVLKLEY